MKNFLIALVLLTAATSYADSQATTTESTAPVPFYKNLKLSHTMWLTGMKSGGALDGQVGPGSDLAAYQITALGYKINSQYTAGIANTIIQYFRQQSQAAAAGDWHNRAFTVAAPYLYATSKSLYTEGEFSSPAFVRLYMPIFDNAMRDSVGKTTDSRYGAIRIGAGPNYNITSKLNAEFYTYGQFRFAKSPPQADPNKSRVTGHQNFFVVMQPKLAYQVFKMADFYGYYSTGRMRHHYNGSFTHLNARDGYGESIGFGSNIAPTKRLAINPDFSWGPDSRSNADFKLKNFSIDFIASYSFL